MKAEAELSTRDDATIFQLMAERGTEAKAAWAEVYRRHVKYVYFICWRSYGNTLGPEGVEDLVHDVFIRTYQKASTFSCSSDSDPAGQRRAVRAWLGTVTSNLFRDRFRNELVLELPGDDFLELCEASSPSQEESQTNLLQRAREALNSLSEREQDVLRTTAQWYQPGARQQRLPHKVVTTLAERCNTSPQNLRQIRSRAMAKFKKFIEQGRSDSSQ